MYRNAGSICIVDIVRLTDYNISISEYGRSTMFDYMTVQEAAKLWELSERRIQKLCKENRIDGAINLSRIWLIPKAAQKPVDARRKKNKKGSL